MKKSIHLSDIKLMLHLLAPNKYDLYIFDPLQKINYNEELKSDIGNESFKVLVNTAPEIIRYKHLTLQDFDLILNFGGTLSIPKKFKQKLFHYINNPDQTMRWVYPSYLPKPTFLNFYNSSSAKAKLFARLCKLTFKTPLFKLFAHGNFNVYYNETLKIEKSLQSLTYHTYSIFTGTVGPNRKVLLELNKNGETRYFVKVALNANSVQLVQNEVHTLRTLNQKEFKNIVIPKVIDADDIAIGVLSNIKPKKVKPINRLHPIHLKAIAEIYDQTIINSEVQRAPFYEKMTVNISQLQQKDKLNDTPEIARLLSFIKEDIDVTTNIPLSVSHSDFTPWNAYISDKKLHLYDWELSRKQMPLLFDLFHFIFQTGILVKHQDFKAIKQEIDTALHHPIIQEIITTYKINVELHYKLYLLTNVSYYLNIYENQQHLHAQAHWLIKVWKAALADVNISDYPENCRKIFIPQFMQRMGSTNYAMLKFHEKTLDRIQDTSDLDLVVLRHDISTIHEYVKHHGLVEKTKIYHKSFMSTLEIYFKDNTFLSLDLIHQFQRKWLHFLNEQSILLSAYPTKEGVFVPDTRFDFEYILLFYFLNRSDIPQKYVDFYHSLPVAQQAKVKSYLTKKYGFHDLSTVTLYKYTNEKRQLILNVLKTNTLNKGILKIRHRINYILDSIIGMQRKGFAITFSGVDGAGKSTTIDSIVQKLSLQFRRKVVVLRHRPSLLPILSTYKYGKEEAQKRVVSSNPRMGMNKNVISSLVRFIYYYSDYMVGQFYIYFKYILRGYIVVYDRYYFDFINDSKRSNIILPKKLVKTLYKLLLKPKLNIFLYASPEVILNRKKELDKETIETLTSDYKDLFEGYSKKYKQSKYIQIENMDLENTIDTIVKEIQHAA